MVSLPPNTTHKVQPLDRAFMKPFKTMYSVKSEELLRKNNAKKILDTNMASLVNTSLTELNVKKKRKINGEIVKIDISQRLKSGFRCTGIKPFNRDIFNKDPTLKWQQQPVAGTSAKNVLEKLMPVPARPNPIKKLGESQHLTSKENIQRLQNISTL